MTAPKKKKPGATPTYEVGYGKPPAQTRFRKGQSGNPSGRPRQNRWERGEEIGLREAYRLVAAREGDTIKKMPLIQAIWRNFYTKAAKGNGISQRAAIKEIRAMERERHEMEMERLRAAIEFQTTMAQERRRMEQQGTTEFHPSMPHPNDVDI